MITLERDVLSPGETKRYGLNYNGPDPYLTAPDGSTLTISSVSVNGVNCATTYLTNSNGVVYIQVVGSAGAGPGAKALAQVTTTLSDGETPARQIELTYQ